MFRTAPMPSAIRSSEVPAPRKFHPKCGVRFVVMKVRAVIKLIEWDGWRQVRQTGSHRQFRHPTKPGKVTVAGHLGEDLHPKTKASIMKQAGLKP